MDVNIVLFCCWFAASGRGRLTREAMTDLLARVSGWRQDIVCSLRAVRDRLKSGYPPAPDDLTGPLRKRIIDTEIECERVEQQLLFEAATGLSQDDTPGRRVDHAAGNLREYLKALKVKPSQSQLAHLGTILGACFPGEDPAYLVDLL